ncbi:hypothetical protein P7M03_25855, partial [Vibrio parahaemolyticus]|nr:hypothetical protein [Vibrio parahaemolyticus]
CESYILNILLSFFALLFQFHLKSFYSFFLTQYYNKKHKGISPLCLLQQRVIPLSFMVFTAYVVFNEAAA